jgi:hypothetical protein
MGCDSREPELFPGTSTEEPNETGADTARVKPTGWGRLGQECSTMQRSIRDSPNSEAVQARKVAVRAP